jgi:hypothetical protein
VGAKVRNGQLEWFRNRARRWRSDEHATATIRAAPGGP